MDMRLLEREGARCTVSIISTLTIGSWTWMVPHKTADTLKTFPTTMNFSFGFVDDK
jgi:hypothetical protein